MQNLPILLIASAPPQVGARLKDNLRGDREDGADTPPSSLAETGAEAKVTLDRYRRFKV